MRRRRLVSAVVLVVASAAATAHAAPRDAGVTVRGSWANPPCATTSLEPRADLTATATCTGVGTLGGSWTGVFTVEVTRAEVNLVTGTTHGRSELTFVGNDTARPWPVQTGVLRMRQVFSVDGTTGGYHGYAVITGGEAAFAGARGCVTFDGFMPAASTATGGYSGVWVLGGKASRRVDSCRPLPRST